jgi:hypothetical protein
MAQRIDQFYEDLRVKLGAIDGDLRGLKAKIDEKAEHVEQEGQKHLDSVRKRVEQNRASAAAARDEMKSWAESRKAATAEKIAEWKVNREISKLQRYADQAERYAEATITIALADVDEAEKAALEAWLTRQEADAAQEKKQKA